MPHKSFKIRKLIQRNAVVRNGLKLITLLLLAVNVGKFAATNDMFSGVLALLFFILFFMVNQAGKK